MTNNTILRIKTNPLNPAIVAGSTPVVFFGDISKSSVATLGINPSKNEFQINGKELTGNLRRFETLSSLGAINLASLTTNQVDRVIESCTNYFTINPYRRWFDQLESNILQKLSASFYSGTACHLDIVQWATDPI